MHGISVLHPNLQIYFDVNRKLWRDPEELARARSVYRLCWYGFPIIFTEIPMEDIPNKYMAKNIRDSFQVSNLLEAWLVLLTENQANDSCFTFPPRGTPPSPQPTSGLWCNVVIPFPIGRYAQHEERSQDVL